jgi:hypothetical protein
VLVEIESSGQRTALVFGLRRGELRSRIRLGEARIMAIAERKGLVVLGRGAHLALLDLRAGRCTGERIMPAPVAAAAIDAHGRMLVIVDADGAVHELAGTSLQIAEQPAEPEPAPSEAPEPAPPPASPAEDEPAPASPARSIPTELLALGPTPRTATLSRRALAAYLDDYRTWVGSLCRTAHAIALDGGQVARGDGAQELEAIVAPSSGRASDILARARAAECEATERFERWNQRGAPHIELAAELGLSSAATTILILAAAPQIWGELARAFGIVARDPARALVDELLLAHLLEADIPGRAALARELDSDAALVRTGAIELGRGARPYMSISVHPTIARRLAGALAPSTPDAIPLDAFIGPCDEIAALANRLARPASPPVRVVIRGRLASGRRTLAASLAAAAGRAIGAIAIDAADADPTRALERALRDVSLRGDLPCVSLDELPDDPAVRARLRTILDRHRGPLFVRAPMFGDLPVGPGYDAIELPQLGESTRRDAWRRALDARAVDSTISDELATKFAVGAGAITRACAAIASDAVDPATRLAAILRQHRSARISTIAQRVDQLAGWDELVVADEIRDALREVVTRVRLGSTVLDAWGMKRVAATARGVTALFQGGPGTGKTMAAGVIARALGFELWRVDLSKVVSKWIGETEKNLDAVFEAAEGGEVVLLFDEADSLFGKRTDVRSGHDRNANLETNYLLQRLDVFTGVAVLTTNFGTAIDPAFRRRLTVHVQFPFPDETERERLWHAHLPRSLPRAGSLDVAGLASKYALSGGYIRNAALRAAFLAAGESSPVTTAHIHRAIALEYQRSGKLGHGRLE